MLLEEMDAKSGKRTVPPSRSARAKLSKAADARFQPETVARNAAGPEKGTVVTSVPSSRRTRRAGEKTDGKQEADGAEKVRGGQTHAQIKPETAKKAESTRKELAGRSDKAVPAVGDGEDGTSKNLSEEDEPSVTRGGSKEVCVWLAPLSTSILC